MSYVELPLYRGSSSNVKVFRLRTINIYVTWNSCTNFRKNIFDRNKVINFFRLDLCFDPLCSAVQFIAKRHATRITWHTMLMLFIIRAFCQRAGPSLQAQESMLQFYQGSNMCGSFPLLSAPHSLFSILTDLKRSKKIPGAPKWRWGEWIWLTGPSGLHRN